jgi:hypothetical protein
LAMTLFLSHFRAICGVYQTGAGSNIATPASHDIPEDKDPRERAVTRMLLGSCSLSLRDLRGPDLALERDHEGRPDERGNTCPAPTRLRSPQGLEDPAPHDAPAETEDDVPEQPYPPPFMAIPASQPPISPTRIDAPNISKCMTRPP